MCLYILFNLLTYIWGSISYGWNVFLFSSDDGDTLYNMNVCTCACACLCMPVHACVCLMYVTCSYIDGGTYVQVPLILIKRWMKQSNSGLGRRGEGGWGAGWGVSVNGILPR